MNLFKDLVKVMTLLTRKISKCKGPQNGAYVRGFVSRGTPTPGPEIKELVDLDGTLMLFKTSLFHHYSAFHIPLCLSFC